MKTEKKVTPQRTEKGYSTKYALSRGIEAVTVKPSEYPDDGNARYVYTVANGFSLHVQLIRGKTFFADLTLAIANAKAQAARKVGALQRQLRAMEKLAKEPKLPL